jgi:hypothetical protein
MSLFKAGETFRNAVLDGNIKPCQYRALIQDLIGESLEIKPALLDLSARRLFQELPLKGSISQKNLSKNELLSELRQIYRDEIVVDLERFVEGAVGLSMPAQSRHIESRYCQDPPKQGSFYSDNPSRLFFLSILSAGLYPLLWTYRHWRHYKKLASKSKPIPLTRQNDSRIIPFWCAFFAGFYIVGASRRIKEKISEYEIQDRVIRPWLVFILFSASSYLVSRLEASDSIEINAFFLSVYISAECMMAAQPATLQHHANHVLQREGAMTQSRPLNFWDWLFIGLGMIVFAVTVIGIILPPSFYSS